MDGPIDVRQFVFVFEHRKVSASQEPAFILTELYAHTARRVSPARLQF